MAGCLADFDWPWLVGSTTIGRVNSPKPGSQLGWGAGIGRLPLHLFCFRASMTDIEGGHSMAAVERFWLSHFTGWLEPRGKAAEDRTWAFDSGVDDSSVLHSSRCAACGYQENRGDKLRTETTQRGLDRRHLLFENSQHIGMRVSWFPFPGVTLADFTLHFMLCALFG